jgi:hypothetical protein|nr:MAG TPA: hypothetical protein [Caudoviricetes sp.]
MYIGKDIRQRANELGLKLYVTKHDDQVVLNIYDLEYDRMLCNYDGYGGKFIRGRHKLLSREAFSKLPLTITKYRQLHETLKALHEIVKAEKAANNLQLQRL